MKKSILFLSDYPLTPEQIRDGFFQRVLDIDDFFKDNNRIYLSVSLFSNFRKQSLVINSNLIFIKCNLFFNLLFIIKLFNNANLVYIQSLFNTLYTFIFIKLIKNVYILDLHGVVPEELALNEKKIHKFIFAFIENFIFNKMNFIISVTKRLENHYKQKYPNSKPTYIIYTIFPKNLAEIDFNKIDNQEQINIIYSGNIQKWQNIDLMLSVIKNNLFTNYKYTILTGDLEGMKNALNKHGLDNEKSIELKSVSPEELVDYYNKANYGFILRDDIIVNNVACPTKLVEYMYYGIIPIVYSDNIGDFKELNYERIQFNTLDSNLLNRKSLRNHEIIKKLRDENKLSLKEKLNI